MTNKYKIRNMTKQEVKDIAIEWAAREGWNPGLFDHEGFYSADPNGFFVGLLNDQSIAAISGVAYYDDFAFLGFYIVKPEYRGKGYGFKIWQAALDYMKTQNIALDGVPDQQPNYRKSGFKLAYRNIRNKHIAQKFDEQFPEITKISQVPFEKLLEYDTRFFPVQRETFLKHWINQPESYGFVSLKGDEITGYSILRKCRNGYKTGPLFAENREIAENLFKSMNNAVPPETEIFLDTPEVNKEAVDLAKKYGMEEVFETARMYTKDEPDIDNSKVFGVTTFELG